MISFSKIKYNNHAFLHLSRQVLLFKYSKVSTPLLKNSIYLKIYFLCTTSIPNLFISIDDILKIWSIDSNLSAISSQSPPICLQNLT